MRNFWLLMVCFSLIICLIHSTARADSYEGTSKGCILSNSSVSKKDNFSGLTDAGPWTKQKSISRKSIAMISLDKSPILSKSTNIIFDYLSNQKGFSLASQEGVNKTIHQNGIITPLKKSDIDKIFNIALSKYDMMILIFIDEGWLKIISSRATSKEQALYNGLLVYLGDNTSIDELDTIITPALPNIINSIEIVNAAN